MQLFGFYVEKINFDVFYIFLSLIVIASPSLERISMPFRALWEEDETVSDGNTIVILYYPLEGTIKRFFSYNAETKLVIDKSIEDIGQELGYDVDGNDVRKCIYNNDVFFYFVTKYRYHSNCEKFNYLIIFYHPSSGFSALPIKLDNFTLTPRLHCNKPGFVSFTGQDRYGKPQSHLYRIAPAPDSPRL